METPPLPSSDGGCAVSTSDPFHEVTALGDAAGTATASDGTATNSSATDASVDISNSTNVAAATVKGDAAVTPTASDGTATNSSATDASGDISTSTNVAAGIMKDISPKAVVNSGPVIRETAASKYQAPESSSEEDSDAEEGRMWGRVCLYKEFISPCKPGPSAAGTSGDTEHSTRILVAMIRRYFAAQKSK
ncbi:mucin-21-like [Periplaneta americana]|uniref:mucin-21-like n=1 Tax=Periplaneta americana TaxID=6978 RepID=UPI0037E8D873